jgi:hypothetical protein
MRASFLLPSRILQAASVESFRNESLATTAAVYEPVFVPLR